MKKLLILVSLFFSISIFAMSQPGLPAIVVSMGTSVDVSFGALAQENANLLANSETEMAANLLPEVKLDLDVCSDGRVLVGLFQPLKIKCSDEEIEVYANALILSRMLAAKRRVVSSSGSMFKNHDKLNLTQYPSSFITKFNDFLENKIKPSELSVGQIIEFLNLADYLQLKEESKIKELCKELINKNVHFEDIKKTGLPDAALKYYLQAYIKEKEKPSELLKNGKITYKQMVAIDHGDWVRAVAISADGKIAVTGSSDKKVIDVATGRVLHKIAHGSCVLAVAISADGKIAVTGSSDGKARIIDVATGRVLHEIDHGDWVNAVAITADGDIVITGSDDKKARIIDVATEKVLHIIDHGDWVRAVAITPDGDIAITGSRDEKLRILKLDLSPIEDADLEQLIKWYNKVNAQQEVSSAPGTSSQASQMNA